MSVVIAKRCVGIVVALAVVLGLTSAVRAGYIVADSFPIVDVTTQLTGRTPETNLPGGVYADNGNTAGWGHPEIVPNAGYARAQAAVGCAVSVASAGSYVKPDELTISGSLHMGGIGGTEDIRGIGLGFYSSVTASGSGLDNFTGLTLNPNGDLSLLVDATVSSAAVCRVPYGDGWDVGNWHTLSYSVSTVTGAISDILLDGASRTLTTNTAAFTDGSRTNYAGFHACGNAGGQWAVLDNFVVSSVPEPSALTMLAAGVFSLLAYAWRKRR